MTAADWATAASLATALGTLILAIATFSAVRSGNRTARAAELSLLTSLRPLLTPSRRSDTPLKVNFGDDKWLQVPGSSGVAEMGGGDGSMGPKDAVLYFAVSLRNVGNGIAILHGWRLCTERQRPNDPPPPLEQFRMQTRDMYIPPGDTGFWQGAVRDLDDPQYDTARKVVEGRQEWILDLLYGDEDGGQRVIGRFRCQPITWARLGASPRSTQGETSSEGSQDAVPSGGSQDAVLSGGSQVAPASKAGADDPRPDPRNDHFYWMLTVARHWSLDRPDPRQADRPVTP